jgi:hypothetical protein
MQPVTNESIGAKLEDAALFALGRVLSFQVFFFIPVV